MRPLASLLPARLLPLTLAVAVATGAPSSTTFTIPDATGIVEGLAYRESTDDFFLSDVHHRCVWRRDRAGQLSRFTSPDDHLAGVFALALDEPHQLLWAATSMLPESTGFTPADRGRCALIALDLATGRLARTLPLPTDGANHVLGDLLLAPDGAIYLTDSLAPIIWRLAGGGQQLERWLESPTFRSLQGIVLSPDRHTLIVSDYPTGLIAVDLATRAVRPLTAPTDASLRGIDGLLLDGGAILAVQNGTRTQRVLRLTLDAALTAVVHAETLLSAAGDLDDFTLPTLVRGRPHVIAQSGWALADPAKSPSIASHPVRIVALSP